MGCCMGDVIKFPRLCPGEIITIEIKGEIIKVVVIQHLNNNLYKIKALEGKYKGYFAEFKLTELNGRKL